MTTQGIVIRKLFFTGDGLPEASLKFEAGLNIIFGGSNAGKSFILKALDFMMGSSSLGLPREGQQYERAYLWLQFPQHEKITLQRSTRGGDLLLFSGFLSESQAKTADGTELKSTAQAVRKKGKPSAQNLSQYILEKIGIRSAKVARNQQGETNQVSLRMLSPYMMVAETEMISEASPLTQRGSRLASVDKSLFRFLVSGKDDDSIIAVRSADKLRANRDGKLELLQELLDAGADKLKDQPSLSELEEQASTLQNSIDQSQEQLSTTQSELDRLQVERRRLHDQRSAEATKASELRAMLVRFGELGTVYASDIERLEGLDEAGFLTDILSQANCPLCGADPEFQTHSHGLDKIASQRTAIGQEIEKIQASQSELQIEVSGLINDVTALDENIHEINSDIKSTEATISQLRPKEGNQRRQFQRAVAQLAKNDTAISAHTQLAGYEDLRESYSSQTFSKQKADGLKLGVESHYSAQFSQTVQSVLEAWNFPDVGVVSFSDSNQDIIVNGRERHDNGKGVRAILHSAFKVGLALYCKDKGLAHPGLLVLDSPLVTYRGPLQFEKYGELQEDEKRLKATSLNSAFYTHLSKNFFNQQVIVLENKDPPSGVADYANIIMFGGEKGVGREGFFPPLASRQ